MSNSEQWRKRDLQHVWHPCTELNSFEASAFPVIDRGEGVYLYDIDGRQYMDGIASWWCVNLGHSHPRLVAALQDQAGRLQHCILGGMTHPNIVALSERLAEITPGDLTYSFYCGDGASAVEAALKIAMQYWFNLGIEGKTEFVGLEEGYHGDTLGAIGVGYVESFHHYYKAALKPGHRACSPHCLQCPYGKEPSSCAIECFEPMERLVRENADRLAAVVVEPLIQGAAGVRIYPEEYLRKLRALCDECNVLLIADEIAVGFGRTGDWFACSKAGITPDIMTMGKGLTGGYMPMSAAIVRPHVFDSFRNGSDGIDKTFYHSHTYGGNPVTAALAVEAINVYTDLNILETMKPQASQLAKGFLDLCTLLPGTRSLHLGMVAVLEVSDQCGGAKRATAIARRAVELGLLIRPRARAIYLWPPLTITTEELARMLTILRQAVLDTEAD